MMKSFIVLLTLILSTTAIDQEFLETARAKIKNKVLECAEEEHASQSDLNSLIALKVPDSHEGKCVVFCTHKKLDLQKEDGSVDREGAMQTLEILKDIDEDYYNKWVKVFNDCAPIPLNSDPCLAAIDIFECIIRDAQAAGIHDIIVE